jgi:micrococcal nuclease
MTAQPPPQKSRIHAFWNRRSWRGKASIYAGAILFDLVVIGLVATAFPDEATNAAENTPPAAAANEPATTTGAATTTVETTTEAPPPPPPPPLRVARVTDGDTLDLDNGDTIRLVQIDAPESKGECYGRKSGTVLRELLPVGTEVRVVRDPALDNIDRYGRKLRYVFKGEENINFVLVQKGAASVWFFNGDQGRYADQLLRAAERASKSRRGAWGACEATLDTSAAFKTEAKHNEPNPPTPAQQGCEPGYDPCLPVTGDLDCADVEALGLAPVSVSGSDPYRLDGDGDGIGCE